MRKFATIVDHTYTFDDSLVQRSAKINGFKSPNKKEKRQFGSNIKVRGNHQIKLDNNDYMLTNASSVPKISRNHLHIKSGMHQVRTNPRAIVLQTK